MKKLLKRSWTRLARYADERPDSLFLRAAGAVVALGVGGAVLVGCGAAGKYTEPFNDSRRGNTNEAPADVITFPDGFNNASTKCDHGNRVYVIYHNDGAYGGVAVVPQDPTCR